MGAIWSGQLLSPAPSLCQAISFSLTLCTGQPPFWAPGPLATEVPSDIFWHSVFVCAITRKDKEFETVIGPNHLLSLEGGLAKIFPLLFVDPYCELTENETDGSTDCALKSILQFELQKKFQRLLIRSIHLQSSTLLQQISAI